MLGPSGLLEELALVLKICLPQELGWVLKHVLRTIVASLSNPAALLVEAGKMIIVSWISFSDGRRPNNVQNCLPDKSWTSWSTIVWPTRNPWTKSNQVFGVSVSPGV